MPFLLLIHSCRSFSWSPRKISFTLTKTLAFHPPPPPTPHTHIFIFWFALNCVDFNRIQFQNYSITKFLSHLTPINLLPHLSVGYFSNLSMFENASLILSSGFQCKNYSISNGVRMVVGRTDKIGLMKKQCINWDTSSSLFSLSFTHTHTESKTM